MPLTPFHFGIGLALGFPLYRWLDFPTLLVATVIVDVRAVLVVLGPLSGNLHGPLHTVLGGTLLACALSVAMYHGKPRLNPVLDRFELDQDRSWSMIGAAGLLGVYSHLVLDGVMHSDMRPFYPLGSNPLLGAATDAELYLVCVLGFLFGGLLYPVHFYRRRTSLS